MSEKMNFKIEKDNTILVLLPTYNRVDGLTRALESIKRQDYKNWKIALVDDGCIVPAKDIASGIFDEDELKNVIFYHTNESAETKLERKNKSTGYDTRDQHAGAYFFPTINQAMNENDFDIGIFLCDDDLLITGYFSALNTFYKHNAEVMYSYSNCVLFDERYEDWQSARTLIHRFLRIGKVNPFMNLDTSQVSWRSSVFKIDGCRLLETSHSNFDAHWYQSIANVHGLCAPNFLLSQYKNFDRNIFNL